MLRIPTTNGLMDTGMAIVYSAVAGQLGNWASRYLGGVLGEALVVAGTAAIMPRQNAISVASVAGYNIGRADLVGQLQSGANPFSFNRG